MREYANITSRLPWLLAFAMAMFAVPWLRGQDTVGSDRAPETSLEDANPGLAELDQATDLRVAADSMKDLEKIVRLCDLALKLGLDQENAVYAKELLTSTLYERAFRLSQPILQRRLMKLFQ